MNIAVTDSAFAQPLIENLDAVATEQGWDVVRVSEEMASDLLLTNRAQLVLTSPLGYARGVAKVDFRIVPTNCVLSAGYSNLAGVNFMGNMEVIQRVASSRPSSFHAVLGSLILREKYGSLASSVAPFKADENVDAIIEEFSTDNPEFTLDLSEEWADIAECSLPMAVWVCRAEAPQDELKQNVERFMRSNNSETTVLEDASDLTDAAPRSGSISYAWSEDVETGLVAVMNLLFFHQIIPELPEVKVLGRDEW